MWSRKTRMRTLTKKKRFKRVDSPVPSLSWISEGSRGFTGTLSWSTAIPNQMAFNLDDATWFGTFSLVFFHPIVFSGTVITLMVSDPRVSVLNDIGTRAGINPFYVAFVLAPIVRDDLIFISQWAASIRHPMLASWLRHITMQRRRRRKPSPFPFQRSRLWFIAIALTLSYLSRELLSWTTLSALVFSSPSFSSAISPGRTQPRQFPSSAFRFILFILLYLPWFNIIIDSFSWRFMPIRKHIAISTRSLS